MMLWFVGMKRDGWRWGWGLEQSKEKRRKRQKEQKMGAGEMCKVLSFLGFVARLFVSLSEAIRPVLLSWSVTLLHAVLRLLVISFSCLSLPCINNPKKGGAECVFWSSPGPGRTPLPHSLDYLGQIPFPKLGTFYAR